MTLTQKKMEKKVNWHKAKHGLITKAKISFGLQKNKGELKRIGEGGEEKKEEGREVQGRFKGMESNIEYGLLRFLVWIHVCGLWVVRNLTLE